MKAKPTIALLMLLLCSQDRVPSQSQSPLGRFLIEKSPPYIGAGLGYGTSLSDGNIGDYPVGEIFLGLPFGVDFQIRCSIGYFRSKSTATAYTLIYRDTEYNAHSGQLWRDISLTLKLLYRLSKVSRIGVAAGLDRVNLEELRAQWSGLRPPIIIAPLTDEVLYFFERTRRRFHAYALGVSTSLDLFPRWAVCPFVDMNLRLVFVGKKYGDPPKNFLPDFSLVVGGKYAF